MSTKTFKGKRPFADIKRRVLKLGGVWRQERYDMGGDFVSFDLKDFYGQPELKVILNTVNGRFIVPMSLDDPDDCFTEESTHLDGTKWYDELLNLLYIPQDKSLSTKHQPRSTDEEIANPRAESSPEAAGRS